MFDVNAVVEIINKSGSSVEVKVGDENVSFSELGLDSLDVFNIFIELQEAIGKEISDEIVDQLVSISDIVLYVNK